jgi:transposase
LLKVDQVHECKRLAADGVSFREIARRLGCSRNTVRAYVRDGKLPGVYRTPAKRPRPVRDEIEDRIRKLLQAEEDSGTPRKQRLTGKRIWQILVGEHGIRCGETTVRKLVRELRNDRRDPLENAFLKLDYEPGRDAQVDFFEAQIDTLDQGRIKCHFLVVRMCYSAKLFVYPAPNQTREALLEGLMRSFDFFGGVPRVLWFDNLTPAVRRVLAGRDRELQHGFAVFKAHYGFEAEFCRPSRGNEKGGVENSVRHVQRCLLSPIPVVRDRQEMQEQCRRFCTEDAERSLVGHDESIETRFRRERGELMPIPAIAFDPSTSCERNVSSHGWIQHGTNFYSVPIRLVRRTVTVRVDAEHVRVSDRAELVAEHRRVYGQHQYVLDIEHYLPLLERKARAVPNALVVKQWLARRDPCWSTLLRELQDQHGPRKGAEDFVATVRLAQQCDLARITDAVRGALAQSSVSHAGVRL